MLSCMGNRQFTSAVGTRRQKTLLCQNDACASLQAQSLQHPDAAKESIGKGECSLCKDTRRTRHRIVTSELLEDVGDRFVDAPYIHEKQ